MKIENKKYLVYGGFAVIVGALGYIAYASIFNKNSNVEETETVTPEEEKYTLENNPFRDMLDNPVIPPKIDWKFNPIDFGYTSNRNPFDITYKPFTTKSVLL